MTDPIVRACEVADLLKAQGLPVTKENMDAVFRALDARDAGCPAPDGYAAAINARRTPEQRAIFAQQAEQLVAIRAAADAVAAKNDAARRALDDHDLEQFAPPDSYKAGLDKMRSGSGR